MTERDPLLIASIPEDKTSPPSRSDELPVIRVTPAPDDSIKSGRTFDPVKEKKRERICGSGRFITFGVIWVVLVVCIVVLAVFVRLEDVDDGRGNYTFPSRTGVIADMGDHNS